MPPASALSKPTIFAVDMEEHMVSSAVEVAQDAFQTAHHSPKSFPAVATKIRSAFDSNFDKCWNCIVGRSFGSFVTHRTKRYIYYSVVPGVSILLWQS